VDMSLVTLIHSGESWPHEQPPCSRQMIHMLERNEEVITWVQVRPYWEAEGGGVGPDTLLASASPNRAPSRTSSR